MFNQELGEIMSKQELGMLVDSWTSVDEIIIYGWGTTAKTYIGDLVKLVNIRFIIDNSPDLEGLFYNDFPIYNYELAKNKIKDTKIVIMAETTALSKIKNFLKNKGYKENIDFTSLERFVCEWGYKHLGKICLLEVHSAITTKCTFNCMNCNMFMPYHKDKFTYSFEELKQNMDLLLQYVDYIFKYQIVGGEPFLNENLAEYVEYIEEKYKERIGHIRVITNGSVLPNEELTKALKLCEVNVSDYTNAINYKDKLEQVIRCFEENDISYTIIPSLKWRDVGFPVNPCKINDTEVRNHMIFCGTSWHGLADKKLYYCNSAWSAEKCGLFRNSNDDYIELEDKEEKPLDIIKLCLGEVGKGYNNFCKVCGGCGLDNSMIVKAGVQM